MSETYTSSDGLILIQTGTDASVWGNLTNVNWQLIETATDGVESIVLTTTTLTLNIADGVASNGRYKLIVFSGSPSGTVTVSITPVNIQKIYKIVNKSSQFLVFTNGSGTTTGVGAGSSEDIYCDGNGNVASYSSSSTTTFANIVDNGALTVGAATNLNGTLGVVGAATLNSTLRVNGSTLMSDLQTNTLELTSTSTYSGLATFNGGVDIGAQTLAQYILSTSLPAVSLVGISGGRAIIFVFGQTVGSRTAFAYGTGVLANGATITLPSGFVASQTTFDASTNTINTGNTAQPVSLLQCSVNSGGVITSTASDNNSHNFTGTANFSFFSYSTTY